MSVMTATFRSPLVRDVKEPAFAQILKKTAFPMIVILTAIQKNKSRPLSLLKFDIVSWLAGLLRVSSRSSTGCAS